jgi:hypothetical protein
MLSTSIITQEGERKHHRDDHRFMERVARHKTMLAKSIPALLKLDAAHMVGIARGLSTVITVVYREAARLVFHLKLFQQYVRRFAVAMGCVCVSNGLVLI